jgi:serine-type D-Ala-D-Ala carboxypeptidase
MADPIAEKMQEGVDEGVFPGGVLLVSYQGQVVHHAAYGQASLIGQPDPVSCDTFYDLASLTKPLAAATAAALLVADGRIHLKDTLGRFVPELQQTNLREASLRHLLNHCSGLPDWRPFYAQIVPDGRRLREMSLSVRRTAMYDAIHRELLIEAVGARSVYSDLGFILLGEILERVSGKDWSALCHSEIFPRLGLKNLFYMSEAGPTGGVSVAGRSFAATEQDEWRGRLLRGEVHDENAAVMGGVSSHAGLFGTAQAVFEAARVWLSAVLGEASPLSPHWAKEFVRRQEIAQGSSWALGWDTPSSGANGEPSSSGRLFSSSSFGHLGYSGTSVWVDPERQLIVVLLTNRVHPTRKNTCIRSFRPALHDAVVQAVLD